MKSFEIIVRQPEIVANCQRNGDYLAKKFRENGFNIGNTISNVIPVVFRDPNQILKIHKYMLNQGYFLSCVMAPAVPVNAPRFRICATSDMTVDQMDSLVNMMLQAIKVHPENQELVELLN